MNSKKSLRELIIEDLSLGPKQRTQVVEDVSRISKSSIQGVYKALRQLKKEEVVVVRKFVVALSSVWLFHEQERIGRIQKTYALKERFFGQSEQEDTSISFTFSTLSELDLFWTHSFLSIEESLPTTQPRISIAPHDWWIYSRNATDSAWVQRLNKNKRNLWVIVTHPETIDKKVIAIRKKQAPSFLQHYYGNPLQQNEYTYYNCMGDYVFKIVLGQTHSKELNTFVTTIKDLPLSPQNEKEILRIMSIKDKSRITIYKSSKKANVIYDKVSKYFI